MALSNHVSTEEYYFLQFGLPLRTLLPLTELLDLQGWPESSTECLNVCFANSCFILYADGLLIHVLYFM